MKPTTKPGALPATPYDHSQAELLFRASNHLALALHQLRHATGDAGIKTATGRAVAAARALKRLSADLEGGAV